MNKKFLILLLATIFYNGVSNSTPIDGQQISDVRLPEEKPPTASPPTAAVDHNDKKIDPVPAVNTSVPIAHNVTSLPQHVETPINKETAHSDSKNSTADPHAVASKNATEDAVKKINTQVIDTNNNKTASTQTIDGKNMNQTTDGKNTTEPVPTNGSSTSKPVTPSGQTTLPPSSSPAATAVPTTNTTTVKPPAVKPTVTTVEPTSASKSSIIAEANTPAPVQEKHFDGPSFIGGIVLTIGLTAIGFIAFKYYKSGKIDMNYRTL